MFPGVESAVLSVGTILFFSTVRSFDKFQHCKAYLFHKPFFA